MPRKSLTRQTMHYVARPHEGARRSPIDGPAAWRGAEMEEREDWRVALGPPEIHEIEIALSRARRSGKHLEEMRKEDFPLPMLSTAVDRWRHELTDGRGFLLLRGLPVERWSQQEAETFFWCLGQHLGMPGAQNPEGDLLGHVRDEGVSTDDPTVRRYRTREAIAFHCDAADVVGLLCLQKARSGGLSRIVSSVSVYNALLERRPDLVDRLYEPFHLDTHGQGGLRSVPIAPCRYAEGALRTFYHSDYFRSTQRHPDLPQLSARDLELLDTYEAIASEAGMYLDMDLEPGDVQLLSNHVILHARTAYEDDPQRPRHLLRLWLSLPTPLSLGTQLRTRASWAGFAGQLVRGRASSLLTQWTGRALGG